jgi:hypothetical protein
MNNGVFDFSEMNAVFDTEAARITGEAARITGEAARITGEAARNNGTNISPMINALKEFIERHDPSNVENDEWFLITINEKKVLNSIMDYLMTVNSDTMVVNMSKFGSVPQVPKLRPRTISGDSQSSSSPPMRTHFPPSISSSNKSATYCRYDELCTRSNCVFVHSRAKINSTHHKLNTLPQKCHFTVMCAKPHCGYIHPKEWKFYEENIAFRNSYANSLK